MAALKDLYWLAGMAEGEGSFYTYTKRGKYRDNTYPELTIQTTDYDVALRMARIMKSSLSRVTPYNSSKLISWKVRLCSTKAIEWMMTLYCLMGERRKTKIREVIAIWKDTIDGRKLRYHARNYISN